MVYLNASECCKTIGCNCAGTRLAESMSNTNFLINIVMIGAIIAITILIYEIISKKDIKEKK